MSLFDVLKSEVTRELADQLGMMEDDTITWAEAKAARDDHRPAHRLPPLSD